MVFDAVPNFKCDRLVWVGALSPDVHHGPGSGYEIRLADVVPRFFPADNVANKIRHFVVGGAAAHQFVQIVVPYGKKTGSNLAV